MPVLVRSVAEQGRPIAQTSVWGSTHLNVGWFDDVDATLDLAACRRLGVESSAARSTAGAPRTTGPTASMMWGFLLPKPAPGVEGESLDDRLLRFQPVITDALERIGLGEVQFEGSSDLRWHGRKLGALTAQDVVACDSVGGFLNLARPDLDLYLSGGAHPRRQVQGQGRQGPDASTCAPPRRWPAGPSATRSCATPSSAPSDGAGIELEPIGTDRGRAEGVHQDRRPGRAATSPCAGCRPSASAPTHRPGAGRRSPTTRAASCAGPAWRSTTPAPSSRP